MTKNQKILIVSVGLIGFGLYLFYKQIKQDAELVKEKESDSNTDVTTKTDWNKILRKGSTGIEVEVLQKALKQLDVDGDFGTKTETRLRNVTGLNQISINQYNNLIKTKIAENLASSKKANFDKVLKKGSKGIEVELLQKSIKQVTVNGNFDTKTEERLKKVVGLNQVSLTIYNELIRKNANKAKEMNAVVAQQGNTTSFTTGLI